MKVAVVANAAAMLAIATAPMASAFTVSRQTHRAIVRDVPAPAGQLETAATLPTNRVHEQFAPLRSANDADDTNEGGFLNDLRLNPTFVLAYVGFLAFAYLRTTAEAAGASQDILNQFLVDPIHPGVNELFAAIFNLLGLVAIPMACLIMPSAGAKEQKLPATPFLVSSAFAGYGGLGLYMMCRRPVTSVTQSDLGWFTANVLENKVFNWLVAANALSTLFVTGFAQALLSDPGNTVQGYVDLCTNTALASASSVDMAILCLTAASLIPEDLERRGVQDAGRANAIAASTLLLPVIGSTIYCALRPSLPKE